MLGAITGDIIGSTFDRAPRKSVDFPLFPEGSRFTDDSVMTVATAFSLLTDGDYAANYRLFGRLYPLAGYGAMFGKWLHEGGSGPYQSWGNGSAMRVSPIGWAFDTEQAVLDAARDSAAVTHDHPEGIKGAQAVALAVFLARGGADKATIRDRITADFGYDLARTTTEIRPCYGFDVSCQGSVPESLICFLEAEDWLHGVRLAISLGGDADTMASIAGAVGEAFFGGVPQPLAARALAMLPTHLVEIVDDFRQAHLPDGTDAEGGPA
jgi:ADP-ribosylglycohydrolase